MDELNVVRRSSRVNPSVIVLVVNLLLEVGRIVVKSMEKGSLSLVFFLFLLRFV